MNSRKAAGAFTEKVNTLVFDDTFVCRKSWSNATECFSSQQGNLHRRLERGLVFLLCYFLFLSFLFFLFFFCFIQQKNYDLARTIAVCQRHQWNSFSPLCSVFYYDLKAENNPCNKLLTMTSSKAKSLK